MTLPELFANPFFTQLAEAVSSSATTITVQAAAPEALQKEGQFRILVGAGEYMLVTGGAGGNGKTWTVTRGVESTAVSHAQGEEVLHLVTAGSIGNQSDAPAGTPSLRSLGTGAQQAAPGTTKAEAEAGAEAVAEAVAKATSEAEVAVEKARAETAEALLAPKASPALTGTPTAPTAAAKTNTTQLATMAAVQTAKGEAETSSDPAGTAAADVKVEKERAEAAENLKAPLASPALTGTPTAPTASEATSNTQLATTAFAHGVATTAKTAAETASDKAGAATTAQAAAEAAATAGTKTEREAREAADALKAPLASPALTGTPKAPTAAAKTSTEQLATTAFAQTAKGEAEAASDKAGAAATAKTEAEAGAKTTSEAEVKVERERAEAAEGLKAPLASPALTGTPTAPTAAKGTNTTQVASTAFVQTAAAEAISGLTAHANVKYATAVALPTNTYLSGVITGTALAALVVDGEAVGVGQRILVKNEAAEANNGIYVATHAGGAAEKYVLTRAADMASTSAEVEKAYTFVEGGKTLKNSGWFVATPGPFTIGTTAIPWGRLPGSGDLVAGEGIVIDGNQISVSGSVATRMSPVTNGAKFDKKLIEDASIEAGKTTLTASELTAADAGKPIMIGGAGVSGATLITKIESAGAGTATLAAAASTTVSGATAVYATDDSAAWNAMAAEMTGGSGYEVVLPRGGSFFNAVSFGSTVSRMGITLKITGAGRRATFLTPLSVSGVGTLMTLNGPGDSTSVGFDLSSLTVGFDFLDPIVNLPPTQPIVHLVNIQSFKIDVLSRHYGTGTLFKLDGSYAGEFAGGRMQTGRYAIGIEVDDEVSSPAQEDTLRFGETFVHEGNYGLVVRNISNGMDSNVLPQFKSAVYTPTKEEGKTFNGFQDREHFSEGHLAKEAKEGTSALELEAGQASTMGYVTANLPLPIMVDYGDHVEMGKVTAATGDVLTLLQPLRWNHATAGVVVRGTVAINYATNFQSITIGDGDHIEGHSCAGIQVAGGKLVTVRGGTSASRVVLRLCGGTENAMVDGVSMVGASAWLGALSGEHNVAIEVPSWNTNASLSRLYTRRLERIGSEVFLPIYDPGSNASKQYTDTETLPEGVPLRTVNLPTGSGARSLLKVRELAEDRLEVQGNGALLYRDDTRVKRRGTGSMIFEYWNGTEWEEAKAVALGAGELRFGEDTALLREAVAKLKTVGQLKAEDGLTTIYLEGAGLVTITDGLFKHTPPNGTIAVHLDTTTGRKYISFRANGLWQLVSYDYDAKGQNGIMTPQSAMGWRPGSLTAATGNAYVMRFKATTGFALTKAAFRLVTAAGSNDKVEVGIYSAAWARLATSGEVEKILNGSLGIATIPITYTLVPGTVYYAAMAFGTVGSTGAVLSGAEYGSGELGKYFGATAGTIEYDSHTGSVPLPEPFVGGGLPTTVPILALRQS